MCGIAGWVARADAAPVPAALAAMTRAVAHRGPDGEGFHHAETRDGRYRAALGHRRLSIIDLVTGDQPMHDARGRVSVVFNGEIYNFRELRRELEGLGCRFRTSSDTEVLLHGWSAWGERMLERLRGMFAFAIWDADSERLLLARDPFGKKPLFLHERDGRLLFASEIKALLAAPEVPAAVDRRAVWSYLLYRYVPGPDTLFAGIRKLPPGSYGIWADGRLAVTRYFRPYDLGARPEVPLPVDPVGSFLRQLETAVELRMVSDVPYGAFLSGGIDSSAVVALMSRHSPHPVVTFSVGFAERQYSELDHARTIAREFRTDHHELAIRPDDLMAELPGLVAFRDAPVAEPSDIPIYLLARRAARQVKMVLTGEGADELLAGYPKHLFERFAAPYQMLVPSALHRALVEPLVEALPYGFRRAKTAIAACGLTDPRERLPRWFGALSRAERAALVAFPDPGGEAGEATPFAAAAAASALRRVLGFDQASWLPDNLLERGDRMTMAASIEARMPFMDHRLAEFVSALPDRFRVRALTGKWLLRQAMRRVLPPAILTRPKIGFRVPVNEWFRAGMRGYLQDHLLGPQSLTRDYYRPQALRRVFDEHVQGRQNHEKLLWTLLTLELFHRQYALPA